MGGFTLVELIVILIIIGVLAVAAIPRFMDQSVFETRGFHDETMSLLRYAQKAAIAQRRSVCVTLNATGVTMMIAGTAPPSTTCNSALAFPSAPRGGTGLSATVGSFTFLASGATDKAANVSISFPDGSGIKVDAVTGYVY
ncbi:methylation [Sulfuricella denitrificans skB26]|uniref:Type II secretion system protein H n=1 Tax=Sulfuricella denitrificans (strain DSM 22764 / NBRC 105220 / skB26) TaxID=1163617 RepID=S6AJG3_SULDS|nr:GspH/FimT family pseudopilin [Sulfuricella denitrificans]BAN36481.1 methylation [Sulfuricella denitrificans skB26]